MPPKKIDKPWKRPTVPLAEAETRCGYLLPDVRKSLRDAIDRRDRRAAYRWAAELVVTPAAVGSLWAAFWMAWSILQTGPTIPILLRQAWDTIADAAHQLDGDWTAFRNEPEVRGLVAELVTRLLDQPRQSPIVWPTREITLYDVAAMTAHGSIYAMPLSADSHAVLSVWQRNDDAVELRLMAGRFLTALESGDLRTGLSAVSWTFQNTLKCAERGPAALTAKTRASPVWFWLEIGGSWLRSRSVHPGWITMHTSVVASFREHYKRWTPLDRMRVLLAWVLQLRSSMKAVDWTAPPIHLHSDEVDLPYKEIAAELADPETVLRGTIKKEREESNKSKTIAKMEEADAMIMTAMGIHEPKSSD